MGKKPAELRELLLKIGARLHSKEKKKAASRKSRVNPKLQSWITEIATHDDLTRYSLDPVDILIIGAAWYQLIIERTLRFDPLELLGSVFPKRECIHRIDRRFDAELSEGAANDYLKAMEWKQRIDQRLEKTKEVFPLQDLADEYQLDHNETVILMYLVREEIGGTVTSTDEVLDLISRDQHEKFANKRYIANDARLIRPGSVGQRSQEHI